MATRVVEGKKPYTWGKAIEIDENKVISLRLRDENNLIIWDEWDNEIYVDLQLDDEITPTSAFPVWITTGRVIVDNWWDEPWTIICAKTTSGDNIKLLYADSGNLYIDNWTWTFKQIYLKADVDALLLALRSYIDDELAKKQNWVVSDTAPENPSEWDLWYNTTNDSMKVWDWNQWSTIWGWWWSDIVYVTQSEYTALLPWAESDGNHYFIFQWTPVTWVTLDESSIILTTPWDTQQLTATVSPNDAYDKSVTWSSSNNSVATVSQTWLVTCVTPWTCIITVTTNDGWFTATCGVSDNSGRPIITWFTYDNKTWAVSQWTYGDCNTIAFKSDWTKVYTSWEAQNTVYQFSLATPRDISTISYDSKSKSVISETSNVTAGIIFSDDGTTMYIWGWWGTWYLFKYTLWTAWDVSTATYDNVQSNVSFTDCASYKIYNNGNYVYVLNRSNYTVYRYTASTPRDITTLWNVQSFQLPDQWGADHWFYHEVVLNPDGTQMFVFSRQIKAVLIFSLSTPRDITTATLVSTSYTTIPNSWDITSMAIDNGWANMYLGWWQLNNIYQYVTTTS